MRHTLKDWLPIVQWGSRYDRSTLVADLTAAAIVTLLLIPQSLALALLAGMPAQTGLYASMLPIVVYALLGSSHQLATGPTALRSIMSASAVGAVVASTGADFLATSALLALMCGVIMLAMGLLRLGFVASFLSHPVLTGFISAAGLLIAASQLKYFLGIPIKAGNVPELLGSLQALPAGPHMPTALTGLAGLALLYASRRWLKSLLLSAGLGQGVADLLHKAAPLFILIGFIALSWAMDLGGRGVAVVGKVPSGLPSLSLPSWGDAPLQLVQALLVPTILISLVGFIESVSVSQSMAAKRRERIDPDAELRGLGAANIAAGLTGAFSVGGSFSRSVVSSDADARTPAFGIFTAAILAITALFFTPALFHLPQAVLAATIMVAVHSLLDFGSFARTWRYSRIDFIAMALTFVVTLMVDIVSGLATGAVVSIVLHLWRSSRPHIAEVGRVPGTEHYRNILRHEVHTMPGVMGLRVDESLYFANARYLEDHVSAQMASHPDVTDLVLQCTAVNDIDASALESLKTINARLRDAAVRLHLSEVKGPVMDRLKRSDLLDQLSGQVFLTHHQAMTAMEQARSDPAAAI
ncbi:sulfate permease [Hydrogenophaga sp. 5NK40-0174]|uniref:SulP family inorganic anion transporter n=1 Tax=Hydrogenophaga sp. 5NK40-0174 TaxID=3127649 RepID=UPI00333F33EC